MAIDTTNVEPKVLSSKIVAFKNTSLSQFCSTNFSAGSSVLYKPNIIFPVYQLSYAQTVVYIDSSFCSSCSQFKS